jgi:hypothetical protein
MGDEVEASEDECLLFRAMEGSGDLLKRRKEQRERKTGCDTLTNYEGRSFSVYGLGVALLRFVRYKLQSNSQKANIIYEYTIQSSFH